MLSTTSLVTSLYLISSNRILVPQTGGNPPGGNPPPNGSQNYSIDRIYMGSFSQREYLPLLVLYDPYGDMSYQKTSSNTSASFTLQMEGKDGVEVNGSIPATIEGGDSSSLSSNASLIGPGKGDGIAGSIWDLTWNVYHVNETNLATNVSRLYYHLDLIASAKVGGFLISRSGLATVSNSSVEDKTGQPANYTQSYIIGYGLAVEHHYNITWSGTVRTGFGFKADFSGMIFNVTYSFLCPTTQTIHVIAHYEDSSQDMDFYEAATSAIARLDEVYSYALWFNAMDISPPLISSPPDQSYLLGNTRGHNITWNAVDEHPWQYGIDEIYQGSWNTVEFGEWHNQSIVYELGNLSPGEHTYICTVRDTEGNIAYDSVTVTVLYPHSITKVFLGYVWQREYIPVIVLYDPYGDKSYQETLITTNAQFTLWMEGENGVEVNGTLPTGISCGVGSSLSSSPGDMGPGIGDTIFGYIIDLGWKVYQYYDTDPNTNITKLYYHLDLVSYQYAGSFALGRTHLAANSGNNTIVDDRTGQLGDHWQHLLLGANTPTNHYYNYSWVGTIKTGFGFKVDFSGIVFNMTYSFICSTPQTIPIQAHYEDSSQILSFYETTDNATPDMSQVFSYALWYASD
jgi:hypothetical protein